jgi:formiminotetrahydrofolate cyclodeaminase
MPASRHRSRPRSRHRGRTTTALTATALVTLALATTAACDAVNAANKALDCVQTADSIAGSVSDLQQAVSNAANDPTQADASLANIDNNLRKIGDKTDNADVNKAVDDLNKAVANVRTAIKNGDNTPDLTPVKNAAGELTKVCTP